jgi:hypothetical protein
MEHTTDRTGGVRGRSLAGSLAAGLAAVALLAGACGGGSPRSAVASGSKAPTGATQKANPLAYSRCMRAHGVPNFPDPDSHGSLSIDGGKVHPESPQYKAADQTCKPLLPGPAAGKGEDPQDRAKGLKYAACMRSHGVPKFPDPNPGGGIGLPDGMDPNAPALTAADKVCNHFMGGGDRVTNSSGPGVGGGS